MCISMRTAKGIRVAEAGKKGRGVFAVQHFESDDLIERAPLLILSASDADGLEDTALSGYWYEFGGGARAVGLGFSSLYNHSIRPNAVYHVIEDPPVIEIVALRAIKAGTEIKINYNGDPKNKSKLWFERQAKDKVKARCKKNDDCPEIVTHYIEYGDWGDEGWTWCGDEVDGTDIPSLVTCKECIRWMTEAKDQLSHWSPLLKPRRITKSGTLISLSWLADQFRDNDHASGAAIADELRRALKHIPAKEFSKQRNGKLK